MFLLCAVRSNEQNVKQKNRSNTLQQTVVYKTIYVFSCTLECFYIRMTFRYECMSSCRKSHYYNVSVYGVAILHANWVHKYLLFTCFFSIFTNAKCKREKYGAFNHRFVSDTFTQTITKKIFNYLSSECVFLLT